MYEIDPENNDSNENGENSSESGSYITNFREFIQKLEEYNVKTVGWQIWYESDENHLDESVSIITEDGSRIQPYEDVVRNDASGNRYYARVSHPIFNFKRSGRANMSDDNWESMLWMMASKFDDSGVFLLDVKKRSVQKTAEYYIPEEEATVEPVDPIEWNFSIDTEEGIWDGPFHPGWTEADKSSPYRLQLWVDPDGFIPESLWRSPYLKDKGFTYKPEKPGWQNWNDYKTPREAIKAAYSFFKTGNEYAQYSLLEEQDKNGKIKGKTAVRVLDAWDNEVYLVNKKGVVKDKRSPFTIQINSYSRTFDPNPKTWRKLDPGHPSNHVFEGVENAKDSFDSINEALLIANKYVEVNDRETFQYNLRIVDKDGKEVEMVYKYVYPSHALSHNKMDVYSLASKPITSNMKLVEISAEDLFSLANDIRHFDQHQWVVNFAKEFYGEKAYMVRISTTSEYNDQGYDQVIESIEVYDEDSNVLSYDHACIQAIIEGDFQRILPAYLQYQDDYAWKDGKEHLNPSGQPYESYKADLDIEYYNVATNEAFRDYIIDGYYIDEYQSDERMNVDATGLDGDYFVQSDFSGDHRWKNMRIFSLVDKS